MDLRTGPGRYRKVLSYIYKMEYGNDLNDANRKENPAAIWRESYVADFTEFYGPLFQC